MWVAIALVFVASLFGAESRSPYIIGGDVSAKGRWPWQVSMQFTYQGQPFQHSCGGSVINDHWVLVAAHCVMYSKNPADYKVRFGMFQQSANDFEQELDVQRIVEHPGFNMQTPGLPNDLCLLETKGTIDLNNQYVAAVPLAVDSETYAGNPDCWISGWGRDDRNSQATSDLLKEHRVPVLTNEVCKEKYGWFDLFQPLSEVHVCMGDPSKEDVHACHGDSGGPLVCKRNGVYELVGVASRTGAADCSTRPSVYIRVSKYLDWLHSNTQ